MTQRAPAKHAQPMKINPRLRTLEVGRLEGDRWSVAATHGGDDDRVAVEPFEAVPLELSQIGPG